MNPIQYFDKAPGVKTRLFKLASDKKAESMRQKTVDEQRAITTKFSELRPIPPNVQVEQVTLNGVSCEWITRPQSDPERVILYLHGGSWAFGNLHTARPTGVLLAEMSAYSVLVVDYRLAPEHPFPAGLEDCCAVYKALLDLGYHHGHIGIFGDSAGGNLSLCLQNKLLEEQVRLPAAVGCASPVTDMTATSSLYRAKPDLLFTVYEDQERDIYSLYLNGHDPLDPLVSPIHGDLSRFPPMLLHVGEDEDLCADNMEFARKAQQQGAQVVCKVWRELFHDFSVVGITIKESRLSLREFVEHFQHYIR